MAWLHRYFFGEWVGKDGSRLLFTRADVGVTAILAFSFMAAIAFAEELRAGRPFVTKFCVSLCVAALMLLVTEKKRLALGCALALIAFRLTLGVFLPGHRGSMLLLAVGGWLLTWVILKDAR